MSGEGDEEKWTATSFTITAFVFQTVLLILYGATGVDYAATNAVTSVSDTHAYGLMSGVSVMIFIGFAFLMTFMQRYTLSAVTYNFVLSAIAVEWALLVTHFFHASVAKDGHYEVLKIEIKMITDGIFAAGSVMIAFGANLGKMTPVQLLWLCILQVVGLGLNFSVITGKMGVIDVGGSLAIHLFGAVVGITSSWAFGMINDKAHPAQIKAAKLDVSSSSSTDTLAMIGAIFLWIYWPSFNGGLTVGNQFSRCVINTYLSLSASCVTAIATSGWLRGGKFSMVDVANPTLAGGVAVGAAADLILGPWGAILIGMVAGIVSVVGFVKIQPWLEEKLSIHDTCGVFQLHGIPGIIGGTAAAAASGLATMSKYDASLVHIWTQMAPSNATLAALAGAANPGEDRTATHQAGLQFAAILVTIGFAIVTGLIIGFLVGSPLFFQLSTKDMFNDHIYFIHEEHAAEEKAVELPFGRLKLNEDGQESLGSDAVSMSEVNSTSGAGQLSSRSMTSDSSEPVSA